MFWIAMLLITTFGVGLGWLVIKALEHDGVYSGFPVNRSGGGGSIYR